MGDFSAEFLHLCLPRGVSYSLFAAEDTDVPVD